MKSQLPLAIILAGVLVAGAIVYRAPAGAPTAAAADPVIAEGVTLPVTWGSLGKQLVEAGAIDEQKFTALYQERGGMTEEQISLLTGENKGKLKITPENSAYLLNLFWALGLASQNSILDEGEMADPAYGGAGKFASTGGWSLSRGPAMDHYSRHSFFTLTAEEQALVDRVSRGIYRPCCNNSTHFPDCNHGMAMLGLLELAASQGVGEEEMYELALAVNSYWFPDTYRTIAAYLAEQGKEWSDVPARELLGKNYSSASGFAEIMAQVQNPVQKGGGGCKV